MGIWGIYGNSLGTWWEQKDIDVLLMGTREVWWELFGNLMGTKRICLKLDGNKRNLIETWWEQRILMSYWWECLGTWWEQKNFDEILVGTRGIRWVLFGNLMGNHPPLQIDNKHPLGGCLHHPIGSPLQKNRKHPWGHVGATQLALLTCFILMCFFRDKLQGWVVPMYGICFLTNCIEGRERKLDGAAQKVGRKCVQTFWEQLCVLLLYLMVNSDILTYIRGIECRESSSHVVTSWHLIHSSIKFWMNIYQDNKVQITY